MEKTIAEKWAAIDYAESYTDQVEAINELLAWPKRPESEDRDA